jgi:serine/threonine protein kinase
MGTVYRAIDSQLLRPVAIKVMHPQFAIQTEFQQRFLQEARASAKLDHPNIIRIYEFDLDNRQLYMVTELVQGGSLRDYLKRLYDERKFIDVAEALALTRQVAFALDYAHSEGLIHRDVKPDNVLLKVANSGTDEQVGFRAILTDFGLAKLAEGGVQSIAANPTGTLPYMSPEQAQADPLDGRTDIYALGIMLYELTTGRLPFMPRSIPEAIKMHTSVPPEPPTKARPSLSPALEAVILKAIAKNPEDRFATAGEFARAIAEVERVGGQIKRGASPVAPANAPDPKPEKVESLGTYLASMAPLATPQLPNLPENLSTTDQIVISTEGKPPRSVPITSNVIEIGRDPSLTVALDSPKVSRTHARVERRPDGQYMITDLGSSNGTYLADTKLLSNIPEVWAPDKLVRMGPFFLTLQRAAVSYQTGVAVQAMPSIMPPGVAAPGVVPNPMATIPGPSSGMPLPGGIDMKLVPPALTVEAGGRNDVRVEIRNLSELVEHYQFHVDGVPKEWFTLPMTTLQLMTARDGESVSRGMVSIGFHPPRNCKSTSGTHTVTIRVTSQDRGKEVGRATFILTINPFYQYKADLQPKKIRNSGNLRIVVKNEGNAAESYTLVPRDREEMLHFDPPEQSITAPACLDEVGVFYVRSVRRPLIALSSKHYPLEVQITASGSPISQPLNGELVLSPRIPWFLLVFLLLLCLLCILAVLLLRCQFFPSYCPAPAAGPNLTYTAQHATLDQWLTSTATSFQIRQTATYDAKATIAATQTQGAKAAADNANANATAAAGTAIAAPTMTEAANQKNQQATLNAALQTSIAPKPNP